VILVDVPSVFLGHLAKWMIFFCNVKKIAPIVRFALLGVIFCLDFNPFPFFKFFLLLFSLLPGFSPFFPFIYLFILNIGYIHR